MPADGHYFLCIGDTQGKGGPDFAYRLRVSEPRPDFALRIVPSSLSVRAGMSVPVTVDVVRKDGFTNALDLRLTDAAPGFSLSGARVAENQDTLQFTLKAPPQGAGRITNIELEGSAVINGQTITRPAVPAENMMQAFAYWHLVPSCELAVAITANPRPFASSAIKVVSATPVKIPAGGVGRIRIATPSPMFADRFKLELSGAPDGISITNVALVENGIELAIAADSEKIKAGASGNLIINVSPKNPGPAAKQKNAAAPARRPAARTLPAIPFKIVEN